MKIGCFFFILIGFIIFKFGFYNLLTILKSLKGDPGYLVIMFISLVLGAFIFHMSHK